MRRAVVMVTVLAGCMWQSADPPPLTASHVEEFEWPGIVPPKMDVVFVIDDTAAMAPYVDRVAGMLRGIEGLWANASSYVMPDLQIAIVTDTGQLHGAPPVHGAFVIDEHRRDLSGLRQRNYDGTLGDAIAAVGAVGTGGTIEQPLQAVRTAIEANPALVRSDAYLAIVIVSATDDASTVAPASAAAWAKGLKADPNAIVVGGVFPASATRLASFVSQFPNRAQTVSIDAPDYAPAIVLLARLYNIDFGVPCLDQPMDVDPQTPGVQLDCAVELVGEDGSVEVEPPCPGPRCWTYRPDPMNCVTTVGGRIDVAPFSWPLMPTMRGQCVVAN